MQSIDVLIVEDEVGVAELHAQFLRQYSYKQRWVWDMRETEERACLITMGYGVGYGELSVIEEAGECLKEIENDLDLSFDLLFLAGTAVSGPFFSPFLLCP